MYIENYIEFLNHSGKAKSTISSYSADLHKFSTYANGEFDILKPKKKDLKDYISFLMVSSVSDSSIKRSAASIKGFYEYLIYKKVIKKNPFSGIELPKTKRSFPICLSVAEVDKLLSIQNLTTFKGKRDKAMLEVLYATGMKVSELIDLSVSDVDLKNNYLVCGSGTKWRTVPLVNSAALALKNYIDSLEFKTDGKLFVNMFGESISRQGFWKILKSYAKSLGIEKQLTPGIVRHSFAMHLAENGLGAESLQKLMGYTTKFSADYYIDKINNEIKNEYISAHPRAKA